MTDSGDVVDAADRAFALVEAVDEAWLYRYASQSVHDGPVGDVPAGRRRGAARLRPRGARGVDTGRVPGGEALMPGLRLQWDDGDVPRETCDHAVIDRPGANPICWRCGRVMEESDDDS